MMCIEEKIFTKNGYFKPNNDVVWANDQCDANERGVLHSMKKYSVFIMAGLGVTWYGLTRSYFFQKGEHLNGHKLIMTNCYLFIERKVINIRSVLCFVHNVGDLGLWKPISTNIL